VKAYRLPVLSLALAWTLFAGVAVFSIGKPLTLDQAWPVAFQAGSIADRGFAELGRGPYEIAHPPLYMHLLALVFLVFGESDFSARALGLALFAVTSILVVRLADLAFPADRGARIGGIAAILYAASPMVVQHSLLVDGTTTLLPAFTCALLVALYRADFRVTGRNAWSIGGWFALCVWVHESLALLPLAALALYLWSAMGLRVAARESFAILTCGLGLFAASWLVYVSTTGVDSLSFVQFSVVEKLLAPGQESAAVLLTRVWTNARWLSLALLALLGTFALRRIRAFSGARTVEPSDLLWIYVGLVLLVTNTLWTQLPRYMFAAYAPICVLLAAGIVHSGVRIAAWALVAGVAAGVALAMLLGDPLLLSMRAYVAWAVVLPVIGAWLALRLTRSIPTAGPQASSTFLLAALSVAVWTHVEQTAPYTTSVSWTEYGESGFSGSRNRSGDSQGSRLCAAPRQPEPLSGVDLYPDVSPAARRSDGSRERGREAVAGGRRDRGTGPILRLPRRPRPRQRGLPRGRAPRRLLGVPASREGTPCALGPRKRHAQCRPSRGLPSRLLEPLVTPRGPSRRKIRSTSSSSCWTRCAWIACRPMGTNGRSLLTWMPSRARACDSTGSSPARVGRFRPTPPSLRDCIQRGTEPRRRTSS
jgi:hypothetical protein